MGRRLASTNLGVYDFAGGIVIHTSAGLASIAAALVLGRRKNFGPDIMVPHNIPLAVLGASLLWLGWFGFNAGSALASGALAANAFLVTQIGAVTSAVVWILLSWKRSKKPSTTAAINGAICGLAGVTPVCWFHNSTKLILFRNCVGVCFVFWNPLDQGKVENR